jgi:mitochondrial import inner membrane translocase subunit TIM23
LTWDRFFDLRRKRRYLNLGSSFITAAGTIGVLGPVIAQQDIDGWAAQISGLDPIIVLGITTFAVATGGWLCGPSFGTAIFKIWAGRKGWNSAIAEVGVIRRDMFVKRLC